MLMGDWAGPPQAGAISFQWVGPEGTRPGICGGGQGGNLGVHRGRQCSFAHIHRELPSLRKFIPAHPIPHTPRQATTASHTLLT